MLNRREFLASAVMAAMLRPGAAMAQAAAANPDDVFLNRLTFGATAADRAALAQMGRVAWLDDQLARPAGDPQIAAVLDTLRLRIEYEAGDDGEGGAWPAVNELRPLATLSADPATLLPLLDWETPMDYSERARPAEEVILAALTRAVHAPAQLREVMTQFWHDHFNVDSSRDEFVAVFFPSHDAMLRDHALGNFRQMLGDVARSPSMLIYLNNAESAASPANENYARELLELHTLGAPHYFNEFYDRWNEVPLDDEGVAQGYIDEDVYEVARAFTGWTVGDGRWISEGVLSDMSGRFYYAEAWHDPYQKRVLGIAFQPNRAPMADGDQVLDILAHHPGTARFVCTKIARRLLADEPDPDLIERMAVLFRDQWQAPDQIAQVVRLLVLDPGFDVPPGKLRRPFEFLAALYRASGVQVGGISNDYHWQLAQSGWLQHTFPPPTGHPDTLEDWLSGTVILRLVDLALYAHDDWFGCTTTRLSSLIPPDMRTLADLGRDWSVRCSGQPQDAMPDLWTAMEALPDDPLPKDEGSRHDLAAMSLAYAALTPQFLFR